MQAFLKKSLWMFWIQLNKWETAFGILVLNLVYISGNFFCVHIYNIIINIRNTSEEQTL